jgi:drug/metabolite transporter, DME family
VDAVRRKIVYPLASYSSMAMAGVAIGTVVSAAGAVLLVLGGDKPGGVAATEEMPGVLLGLVAGCTYAGYSFAARKLIQTGQRSRAVIGALFGFGSVLLLPVLAVTGRSLLCSTPGLLVAGYLALVPMSMACLLFGGALRYVGATAATTLSLIEPAIAAVLSVLVVGDRLSTLAWTGTRLVATGLLMLVVRRGNP